LYGGPNAISNVIGYAEHYSRSHDAVIRVYDAAGKRDREQLVWGLYESQSQRRQF